MYVPGTSHHPVQVFGKSGRQAGECKTGSGSKNAANHENMVQTQTILSSSKLHPRWRLRVYHAVIQNKLIYGLETVHLTQSTLKKINVFHLRGLRSILGLETTFVNRRNTNEFVLRTASEHAGQQIRFRTSSSKRELH